MAEESDGIAEAFEGQIRVMVTAAGHVGERIARAREDALRRAQSASEREARELRSRFDAEQRAARTEYGNVYRAEWWERSTPEDIGRMFQTARAWSQGEVGVSVWEVAEEHLDERVLLQRYDALLAGRLDPTPRPRGVGSGLAPEVVVRPEASRRATVLEVRAADRPGVVHLVCAALARLDVTVSSAHIDTLGPQAVDVFYVSDGAGRSLPPELAATIGEQVGTALRA